MPELWITLRTPNRRALTVLVDGPLVVGRDCDGLILSDQRVSRRHTSFEPAGDKIKVTDLASSNGTAVNGTLLTAPTIAGPGDLITIGDTIISIQRADSAADGGARRSSKTELNTPVDATTKTSIELVAEAVQEADPDGVFGAGVFGAGVLGAGVLGAQVVGAEDEPGTLTVVFSDIESSTELAVSLGDGEWFEVLGRHNELVATHVDAHQGRIVKNQGDGYMICFRSARQALLSSIGIQRDLDRLATSILKAPDETDPGRRLRVRIGAHTGEVMMQGDGDLFGRHVIVAARIGALATGGQILVSNLLKQIAEPRGDIRFGAAVEAHLKGIDGTTLLHDVDWASYTSS